MKKFLLPFFVSLLAFSSILHAQKQQPQWEMPFYFEDADGVKDTVWVGYDPEASIFSDVVDTIFDEDYYSIDTASFHTFVFSKSGGLLVRKRSITSVDTHGREMPIKIQFNKGKLPLKITWQDSILNSDSIPFPDISPMFRAKVWIENDFAAGHPDPPVPCGSHSYWVITEDPAYLLLIDECLLQDSLILTTADNIFYTVETGIYSINLKIVPSDRPNETGIENLRRERIKFSPNPFVESLRIIKHNSEKREIILFDQLTREVSRIIMQPEEQQRDWSLSDLPAGIYFLEERSDTGSIMHRVIKSP